MTKQDRYSGLEVTKENLSQFRIAAKEAKRLGYIVRIKKQKKSKKKL